MNEVNGAMVTYVYANSLSFIKRYTDGLTTEESLLQPPDGGNCLNWVLGHLAISRTVVLYLLDVPSFVTRAEYAAYIFGSAPITPEAVAAQDITVHSLEKLLADLEHAQTLMATALADKSAADLAVQFQDKDYTVAERLMYMAFHEGFHTGQLEHLRRLARPDEEPLW